MNKMDKSEKFWDRISSRLESNARDQEAYDNTIANIKAYLKPGDIVLDYTCGTGEMCNNLVSSVQKIQAIDISQRMLDIAQRKTSVRQIENVEYFKSTIFDDRLEKESFNVILAFYILHFLDDTREVLRRINTLLKPGGIFISGTACMGESKPFFGIFIRLLAKLGIVPSLKLFKFADLKELMTRADFQLLEAEEIGLSPTEFYIVVKKYSLYEGAE